MKTLEEQVASKCKHFNGIMNECCKIGIKYSDVRVGKPYLFPCIKTGGSCAKSEYLSPEEVKDKIAEFAKMEGIALGAYVKVKEHYKNTKQNPGKLPCECGGELNYTVAESNGHIWLRCKDCGIYINE